MNKYSYIIFLAIVIITPCCSGSTPIPIKNSNQPEPIKINDNKGSKLINEEINWLGRYEYNLVWQTEGQDIKNIISYKLDIYKKEKELLADLKATGYMTDIDLRCKCTIEDNKLNIYYIEDGEDNRYHEFEEGDHMLALQWKKGKLLTYWNKFHPEEKVKNGAVYFRKENNSKKQ